MTARPQSPRLTPLSNEELASDEIRELLAPTAALGSSATNIFATLVRHPGLFRKWMPFGGKLLVGKLPPRDRELLILRTAWRCQCQYEWGQHVRIALASGLTAAEIDRVAEGPAASGWSGGDIAVLTAADELHDDGCISDATWAALAERYDEQQLIEVPMVVGHYHMIAFTLNSLGVQREDGVSGLPEG